VAREAALASPVVVGAAGEPRNRAALPGLQFPEDSSPLGGGPGDLPGGPAVAGGLVSRSRGSSDAQGPPGSIGEAVASGALPLAGGVATATTGEDLHQDEEAAQDLEAASDRPGFVRRHAAWLAAGAILLASLLLGLAGFVWWLSSQWYVGSQAGYVAVYQGVPQSLAGIPLSRVTTQTGLPLALLPYYDQQQVERTIDAGTEAEAARIVADLGAKAAACSADPPPLGCPTASIGTPGSTGTGTPSPGATPTSSPPASPSPAP
jgi:protein phosphatase